MSVQGVQPKLSARLNIKEEKFEVVDIGGRYILKPQHHIFPEMPENEDLTMKLAHEIGLEIPVHGLIWSKDNSLTYFIRRFDRRGRNDKVPVEDFAQLAELSRIQNMIYDLINTTIEYRNPEDEIALPINGKKKNLTHSDLINYFALERCELTTKSIDKVLEAVSTALTIPHTTTSISPLSIPDCPLLLNC